jgi:hypothetical protein
MVYEVVRGRRFSTASSVVQSVAGGAALVSAAAQHVLLMLRLPSGPWGLPCEAESAERKLLTVQALQAYNLLGRLGGSDQPSYARAVARAGRRDAGRPVALRRVRFHGRAECPG